MSKIIEQKRINELGEFDSNGRIFVNPKTLSITDLSDVSILHCGVDTVRQMYKGRIKNEVLELFEEPALVSFAGERWHAGRVGKDSGYQYKLQNADLGLILLIKNFNVHKNDNGPHLKIEVSPHFLQSNEPKKVQDVLDSLASNVLDDCTHNYCAVHIAMDVQGWSPEHNLVSNMNCRSNKVVDFSGISTFNAAATATVYGRGESFLFGSASACQLSIYNKTIQSKAIDKLDYWRHIWRQRTDENFTPIFDDNADVWRIEFRYHHSVIKQFADGSCNVHTGEQISPLNFLELAPHLDGILKYGFDNFRLLSSDHSKVLSAAWCLFSSDVHVDTGVSSLIDETEYKRYYKRASGFSCKNVELFLGNFVSLLARERVGATRGFEQLKKSVIWPVIKEFFENKNETEKDCYLWIKNKLEERVIRWGRAV